jgi:crossover junction endodeoxyribonuclease RuvC
MSAVYLGIDPGNEGALALMSVASTAGLVEVADMPCVSDGTKGRPTVNAALLADIIRRWAPTVAFLEYVGARPTDSKVGAFAFGRCKGAIEGVCGALGVPVTTLTVPTWRKAVGLPVGATKDMARGEAIRRWPTMASHFARVADDGRAEAALIALAGLIRERAR